MSLKASQEAISSQTVAHFIKLLSENKETLLKDKGVQTELLNLKDYLLKIEDWVLEIRTKRASETLSKMSEEERRMLSMTPGEKKFFLEYKRTNPENPWNYFKAYQKKRQKEYKTKQKE